MTTQADSEHQIAPVSTPSALSTVDTETGNEFLPTWAATSSDATYIVYLELSEDSNLRQALMDVRERLCRRFGPDKSALYPLHCSMTSFFSVTVDQSLSVRKPLTLIEQCIARVIHDAVPKSEIPFSVEHPLILNAKGDLVGLEGCDSLALLPVSARFWTDEQNGHSKLIDLCRELDTALSSLREVRQIHSTHGRPNPIAPKPMRHVSLRNISAAERCEREYVVKQFSEALKRALISDQPSFWDLVVYRVEEWGIIDNQEGIRSHHLHQCLRLQKVGQSVNSISGQE